MFKLIIITKKNVLILLTVFYVICGAGFKNYNKNVESQTFFLQN